MTISPRTVSPSLRFLMSSLPILFLAMLLARSPIAAADSPSGTASSGPILETSLDALAKGVGLDTVQSTEQSLRRPVKIAILDNGFRGYKDSLGSLIPRSTKIRVGPVAVDPKTEDEHGLKMAEIVSGLLDRTETNYELHLFYAFGYSNLKSAVDQVISEKFDVVLYSQVWEYGGNGDGRGFINSLISKATAANILWVNAAGNFAKTTYLAPVERIADDWAYLPGPNESVQLRCFRNSSGKCRLRLVLSWNSFSDDVNIGTDKDLDLVLTDDTLKVVKTAGLIQKKSVTGELGASLYPREIIEADVEPGVYFARVKVRSKNFTKADTLRITASGDFLEMLNRTEGETLLAPADLPSVISIGASDSVNSSTSRKLAKPDLRSTSLITTESELQFKGSSNSSAAYAARIATEVFNRGPLSREAVLSLLQGGKAPRTGGRAQAPNTNLDKVTTDITSPRGSCFPYEALRFNTPQIIMMMKSGGTIVDTMSGLKIFIDEDPFVRAARLGLMVNDDGTGREILLADLSGLFSAPKASRALLGSGGTVEIVKTPPNVSYCSLR